MEIRFQRFIQNVNLPIILRMVRGVMSQLSTQTRQQVNPKITSENWFSITNKKPGVSM
jgi:hypothetical protein